MAFLIHQLDNLDYGQAEPLLDDYIEDALEEFVESQAGQAHIKLYPEGGAWIEIFIEMAFCYGGYTLPKMTKGEAQTVMEAILPRKLVLADLSDTDDAIPELVAFWTYLHEIYRLRSAKAIAKYLESIADQFPRWMFDPARGGMAKQLILEGVAKGFDMTTQEGIQAFQASQKASLASSAGLPPMTMTTTTTTPPDDMQATFDRLGIDLPPVGAPVNLMALLDRANAYSGREQAK